MAEQLPRGLLADPAMQRAMLLPVARRTFTDPVDDITEEQALELAMPGLLGQRLYTATTPDGAI